LNNNSDNEILNNQNNQNQKINNITPSKPETFVNSGIYTLIQILLLITAIAAMSLFLTFLPMKFTYDYPVTVMPVICEASSGLIQLDNIYESEIPKPKRDVLPFYDFSKPVPEGVTYPPEYFSDTVFIGDSRTVGLILYTKLRTIDFSQVGLNIGLLSSKSYLRYTDENGEKREVTCMEALELEKGNYSAIYISLGLNELGWEANSFIKTYRNVLTEIRNITDVPIYIQLIIPVTAEASEKSTFGITNEKAVQFNSLMRTLAEEMQVFLLDPTELFALEDGTLNPEDAFDGVHLTTPAYKKLLAFYQSHVVDPNDYENLRPSDEINQ
jgi:lysophospholipase L1-like esterase